MPEGRVEILQHYCKGCLLCVDACPQKVLAASDIINKSGYHPVKQINDKCIGCGICAARCPDAAIKVFRKE
jgi:2-oxoglutarate ferredoxin oxidoreductase subunit delta